MVTMRRGYHSVVRVALCASHNLRGYGVGPRNRASVVRTTGERILVVDVRYADGESQYHLTSLGCSAEWCAYYDFVVRIIYMFVRERNDTNVVKQYITICRVIITFTWKLFMYWLDCSDKRQVKTIPMQCQLQTRVNAYNLLFAFIKVFLLLLVSTSLMLRQDLGSASDFLVRAQANASLCCRCLPLQCFLYSCKRNESLDYLLRIECCAFDCCYANAVLSIVVYQY